jgi:hypothetical protein
MKQPEKAAENKFFLFLTTKKGTENKKFLIFDGKKMLLKIKYFWRRSLKINVIYDCQMQAKIAYFWWYSRDFQQYLKIGGFPIVNGSRSYPKKS